MNARNRNTRLALSSFALVAALAALGCSQDAGYGTGPSNTNASNNNASGAYAPSVAITSPAKGASVSGAQLTVEVQTAYFTITKPGGALKDGEGHVHLFIDNAPEGSAETAVISQGQSPVTATLPMPTTPGTHYLIAELEKNDHSSYGIQDSVAFTVTAASPAPAPANNGGYSNYSGY